MSDGEFEEITTRSRTFEVGKKIDKYELVKRIGKGGFGSIWAAKDENGKTIAIKAEKRKHHADTLMVEESCLHQLQDSPYFPIIYEEKIIPRYNILIMECLGPSLRKLRHKTRGNRFSLSTVLRVGIETLRAVKAFHEHGFIHRDIKPDNFVLRPSRSAPLALIDYGLCRRYLTPEGEKIPLRPYVGFTGTNKFAPIATHNHEEQLRRDDCQSWYYSFLQMLLGRLPWSGIDRRDEVFRLKKETNFIELLRTKPPQLLQIHDILFNLKHEDEPPYDEIIGLLEEVFEQSGFSWDDKYDWEYIKPKKMRHMSSIDLTPPLNDHPIIPLTPPKLRMRSASLAIINCNPEESGISPLLGSSADFSTLPELEDLPGPHRRPRRQSTLPPGQRRPHVDLDDNKPLSLLETHQ